MAKITETTSYQFEGESFKVVNVKINAGLKLLENEDESSVIVVDMDNTILWRIDNTEEGSLRITDVTPEATPRSKM